MRTLKRLGPSFCLTSACVFVLLLWIPSGAQGVTLQSAYDAAPRQSGYDKYLDLSPGVTYTGGITIPNGDSVCIKGHGARIDLEGSMIQVGGAAALLDIDHCVILNGGDPAYGSGHAGLNFIASYGSVMNNTIYGNTVGVRVYMAAPGAVKIKNNIIVKNLTAGVLWQIDCDPVVSYNDCWGNTGYGSYAMDCGCSNGGTKPWSPSPGTGEISADPLFMNESLLDFHLSAESPCINAGDPPDVDMGALGAPTAVESTSWGRIKAMLGH